MAEESFRMEQRILQAPYPPIRVDIYHENTLSRPILETFLETIEDGRVGVAPAYGAKCVLVAIALSSDSCVLLIRLSTPKKSSKKSQKQPQGKPATGRGLLQELVFGDSTRKYAFKMDKVASSLYLDIGISIQHGIDLLSAVKGERRSLDALMNALGGETKLHKAQVSLLFKQEESTSADVRDTIMQAWAAYQSAVQMSTKLANASEINTQSMKETHLAVLTKTIRDADRLMALKPTKMKNEVAKEFTHDKGKLEVVSTRYKTRIMSSGHDQVLEIQTTINGNLTKIRGRATNISGRAATITLHKPFHGKIHSVTTVGREPFTKAESMRAHILLTTLQGTNSLMAQSFVRCIWLNEGISWTDTPSSSIPVYLHFPSPRTLNSSQTKAVNKILSNSDRDRIALIHGPPGTGKTTVIAATVTSMMASADITRTLWLVAHSNVAVKNIAEKLADVGFWDFKILVSKEFHFDWHEHLYEKIDDNLIRSDQFVDDLVAIDRLLLGSRVVLCTLSLLSNARLSTFVRLVPPQVIIFDEASQIEIGDYLPPLNRFRPTLRKLVFIGDDKQLAPYGQSDVSDLRSIFEVPHLRKRAIFLDTQYRMPVPIGKFISQKVYEGRLKTSHDITATSSCSFIDVANGKEEKKGHSWMNLREVQMAVHLARMFQGANKKYRIISPYDGQRSMLEKALKDAKLSWENRCFNVDSFQGNEEDHIIVSLVRSKNIGFLHEKRRVNVMLSRCKKSMVILTSRAFVEGKASSSLVGGLAKSLGPGVWVPAERVLNGSFRP